MKYAGTPEDHKSRQGQDFIIRWQPPELRGARFAADAALALLVQFACLPLVTPYRQETPDWMRFEYYKIDALVTPGTDLNGARAMLRTALTKRLGLQYHITDRQTSVYYLVRGSGPLRLRASVSADPSGGIRQTAWVFRFKAADIPSLAGFLSSVVGREVIDKTGIQGKYEFDLDWSSELQSLRGGPQIEGFGVAANGLKPLGLKLEAGKDARKVLIVDRADKNPTPN